MPTNDHYPRRILLAVAAKSPQIVTETLFALACQTKPRWLPTEIQVITTGIGYSNIKKLCAAGEDWLGRLCRDYDLPVLDLPEQHIHVITDAQQQPLEDIRSSEDNACAADFITRYVRELTTDGDSSLHVSLSGGRRTMTYYMGYALSLFGRSQDRLSHVLIKDQYFFNDDFYYPPPYEQWIACQNGEYVDARCIEVTLADLPFVRMRDSLPVDLLAGQQSFTETIAAAQAQFDPPKVSMDWSQGCLYCAGKLIDMPPAQLAFYAWLLQRCLQQCPPFRWTDDETPALHEQYLDVYQRLYGITGHYERSALSLKKGLSKSWLEERKSNTNKVLQQVLGNKLAQPYLIQAQGKYAERRYRLTLPNYVINFFD